MILNFSQQANWPFYNDFLQQQAQLIEWSSKWQKWISHLFNHANGGFRSKINSNSNLSHHWTCQPIHISVWPEIKIRSFHFSQIQKNFLNMWFIWEWLCDWNSLPRLTYDFIETGSIKLRIWFDRKLWKRRKFDTRQDWITLYGFWESVLHHLDISQVL